jgi:hypothetical protein
LGQLLGFSRRAVRAPRDARTALAVRFDRINPLQYPSGKRRINVKVRFKASDMASWEVLNRRRLDLVDKEVEQGLTAAEGTELRALQKKADAYLDIVAPLPFEIFDKLRECAKVDGLDVSFLEEE